MTTELPKEIRDKIEGESKAKYVDNDEMSEIEKYVQHSKAHGYMIGATAWAQIAIGFKNWCEENEIMAIMDNRVEKTKSTEELLIEYLKTLPQ